MTFEDQFTIPSDLRFVAGLAERIRDILQLHRVATEVALEIEICLVEAVNNSIEHGYAGDDGQVVEVRTALKSEVLSIEVRDSGRGLDLEHLNAIQRLQPQADDIETLCERGRGLAIIKAVMNEVSYRQRGGVNTLRMAVRIPVDAGGVGD